MSATLFYRIAAGLLIFFALAHTAGMQSSKSSSPQASLVRRAMEDVHFNNMGSSNTYFGYYRGFGLSLSAYLLFAAFVAWHLGGLARRNTAAVGGLGWALFAVQTVLFVLCCLYFFAAPIIVSGLIVVCLGIAAARPAASHT
jgi:hypothetical protein